MTILVIMAAVLAGCGGLSALAGLVAYCLTTKDVPWHGVLFLCGCVAVAAGIILAVAAGAWWLAVEMGIRAFAGVVLAVAAVLGMVATISLMREDRP